jgi:hypothetical protein
VLWVAYATHSTLKPVWALEEEKDLLLLPGFETLTVQPDCATADSY